MVPANAPETHAQLVMRHNVQTYFTGRTASVLGSYYTAQCVTHSAHAPLLRIVNERTGRNPSASAQVGLVWAELGPEPPPRGRRRGS